MDKIRIRGGRPLQGIIPVGGAKNAALPLMAASLLTDQTLTLVNIPHLADITTLANLLGTLGVEIALDGHAPNGGHAGRALALTARKLTSRSRSSALPCTCSAANRFSVALLSFSKEAENSCSTLVAIAHCQSRRCTKLGVVETSTSLLTWLGASNAQCSAICPPSDHPHSATGSSWCSAYQCSDSCRARPSKLYDVSPGLAPHPGRSTQCTRKP